MTRAGARTKDGYFPAGSMVRRVLGERVLALSGPRALLMQAAHPLAVFGLLAHSSALEEPYERLARTAEAMNALTFGGRREADAIAAHIRAMHRRVRGRLPHPVGRHPAGTPYRADDPELLLWVLFTLADSADLVYRVYVAPLSREEREQLWQDYRVLGGLLGLAPEQMPATLADLHRYRRRMLGGQELHVTDWARERARQIVMEPPVPLLARPALETANFITVALLPAAIRRQYGFAPVPPQLVRGLLVAGGARWFRHGVLPFMPSRLRLVPAARRAAAAAA